MEIANYVSDRFGSGRPRGPEWNECTVAAGYAGAGFSGIKFLWNYLARSLGQFVAISSGLALRRVNVPVWTVPSVPSPV